MGKVMYNVLHIMAGADAGGISTVVLNYYRAIDRSKIHFDIAVTTDLIGQNAFEMEKLGAVIYGLPLKSRGIKAFEIALTELLKKGHYHAVHVHENETSYVALRTAKKVGVPQRIAHAHTTAPFISIKGELRRISGCILNCYYATNIIGCGQLAGERVFGKNNMRKEKACVLPNAIDCEKYRFNTQIREKVRKELGVEKKYVVGMVGRLSDEKNYGKALEIVREYHKLNPNVILICAGNGEMEPEIRTQISGNRMENYVRLLGKRSDVANLYAGFDVLLMPSKYEGFPVAAVEAICAGLPVLMSNTITGELRTCAGVYYLPLTDNRQWIERLSQFADCDSPNRSRGPEELKNHDLDIEHTAKQLENIYMNFGANAK